MHVFKQEIVSDVDIIKAYLSETKSFKENLAETSQKLEADIAILKLLVIEQN